jgi:hypothetical protein
MRMQRRGKVGLWTAALVGVSVTTGCEVTNPGPVDDAFLTLPASQQGMVTGARERLNRAVGYVVYSTALVSREIFPGGQTGSYGHTVAEQAGAHAWGAGGPNTIYNNAQQSRWIAEEAIRRFTEVGGVAPTLMAEAHIWAGYANRVLGENWCVGAIDGGVPFWAITEATATVDRAGWEMYFKRAEDHFTKAIALAGNNQNLRLAATAGRAQARVWMQDWAGAVSDAQQISNSYKFEIDMDISTNANVNQRNHLYFASSSSPYRSYTVRFTFADEYYTASGDPRMRWGQYTLASDRLCVGSLQGLGRVPCTRQMRYMSEDDNIRLSSGHEMRLIEAEALLVAGNWQDAMTKINQLRATITSDATSQPLQPWTATNLEGAWTVLKRERGIELWLEGRRMGDQRRWQPMLGADGVTPFGPGTPGDLELPNFEARSTVFSLNPRGRPLQSGGLEPRVLCYNVTAAERNNNPNFAEDSEG